MATNVNGYVCEEKKTLKVVWLVSTSASPSWRCLVSLERVKERVSYFPSSILSYIASLSGY